MTHHTLSTLMRKERYNLPLTSVRIEYTSARITVLLFAQKGITAREIYIDQSLCPDRAIGNVGDSHHAATTDGEIRSDEDRTMQRNRRRSWRTDARRRYIRLRFRVSYLSTQLTYVLYTISHL
jgi:hypothetical protein